MKISNLMTVTTISTSSDKKELPKFDKRTEISVIKLVEQPFDGGRGYIQYYPKATWIVVGGSGEQFECSFNRFVWDGEHKNGRQLQAAAIAHLYKGNETLEFHVVSGAGKGKPGEGRLSYQVVA
jgi:hypothetical protein